MSGGASSGGRAFMMHLPIASPAGSDAGRNADNRRARASTSWRMQAEKWLGATSRSGKLPVRHCASANGQRGWKRQPDGRVGEVGRAARRWVGDVASSSCRRRRHAAQQARPCRDAAARGRGPACRRARRYGRHTSRRRAGSSGPRRPCRGSPGALRAAGPCCSSARSLRIWSWIVTSSAVVGSSARMMRGLQASAAAITTRWHMPPLNS